MDVAPLLAALGAAPKRVIADSRRVAQGDAFAAFPGETFDGRSFIPDAIARGVAAVLFEPSGFRWRDEWHATHQPVDDLKSKLGAISDAVFGHPSQSLWMVGIT